MSVDSQCCQRPLNAKLMNKTNEKNLIKQDPSLIVYK